MDGTLTVRCGVQEPDRNHLYACLSFMKQCFDILLKGVGNVRFVNNRTQPWTAKPSRRSAMRGFYQF